MSTAANNTKAAGSYHPEGYGMSQGLKRARNPFLGRNAITGGAILVFVTGVYWYSISAVKQDDFADVQDLLPPVSARANIKTIEEELAEKKLRGPEQYVALPASTSTTSSASSSYNNGSEIVKPSPQMSQSGLSIDLPTSAGGSISSGYVPITPNTSNGVSLAPLDLNKASSSSSSSSSKPTTEELMRMFRFPIFSGRTGGLGVKSAEGVNVDRLGTIKDGRIVDGKRWL